MNQQRSAGRRIGGAAVSAPLLVMTWEDWLTFAAAVIAFLSVAISIEHANWVKNMPALVPTALAGLLIGMIGARIKTKAIAIHPLALILGLAVVALVVQSYAEGATVAERLEDVRVRMREWVDVVRAGDISNDNLPFVTLVHGICFLAAYLAAWSIFRWRNAWLAIIPGGMVLLANISFLKGQPSGAFIVFLFGAIVLIARLHLQRSQARWRRHGVDYPELMSVSAIQLTVVVSAALIVFAWALPVGNQASAAKSVFDVLSQPVRGQSDTLVRLFHNVDSRKGAPLHPFGDFLTIQGHVKLGTKDIFEINSPEPGLVRAQSYEEYTGTGWKVAGRQERRIDGGDLAATPNEPGYQARTTSILRVKVLDSESTILTPGSPFGTNLPSIAEGPKGVPGEIERLQSRKGLGANDAYNSVGTQSAATAEQLLAAGTAYPDWVSGRYLQLPKELPQRVRDEARRVTNPGKSTPYEQAVAVENYLRTFPYNLDVESAPPGRDTVDFFLFDQKAGYFDYQSTAMAVMLRTLGIPARVAVGYVLDPASAEETKYTVRKNDAYSWVEVFFPNYGWVNFNPTRDRPQGGAGGIGGGLANGPDIVDPLGLNGLLGPDAFEKPVPGSPTDLALNEAPTVHGDLPWVLIWSLAGVLTLAAAVVVTGRVSWSWGMSGLEGRARLWAKVQRVAGWAGLGSRPAETPREWSRRLGGAIDREDDATHLADAYEEARYGRPDLQRIDDAVAAKSYTSLRNTLIGAIFHRKRTPPRK
jgi:transglutaminase-like putative cysteine protease